MGAICETKKVAPKDTESNHEQVKQEEEQPQLLPQQIEQLPIKEIKYYTYKCPINLNNINQINTNNNINNSTSSNHQHKIHLILTLSNIKINQSFSRDKTTKKSLFIFEMQLGYKVLPLYFHYGEYPIINERFEEKININMYSELSSIYLKINVYEIISEFEQEKLISFRKDPKQLKTYISYSKHCSYFQMDILSFVFRANKLDFPLLGRKPISSSGRISFQLDIEQLCCFHIIIEDKDNTNNVQKSEFILNSKKFNSKANNVNNKYSMKTIPLSMNDIACSDFYIQKNDKNLDNYEYYSLNELKAKLLKELGNNIVKNFAYLLFGASEDQRQPINIKNLFPQSITKKNNKYSITIMNLPVIFQAKNLYFTEQGYKFNTSLLYLISKDENIMKYYKGKGILYEEIHPKFEKSMQALRSHHKMDRTLFEIQEYLSKSVESNRYMYKYRFEEELNNTIMMFMELGVKLIKIVQKTDDQSKIITIIEIITQLLRREELNNEVLFYYIKKFEPRGTNIKALYNDFFLYLFKLNKIVKEKINENMYESLIDIYISLYFRSSLAREALLNSLSFQVKDYETSTIDNFLYDIKYDDNLNSIYLTDTSKDTLNTTMVKTSEYFSNLVDKGYYLLIKKIWNYQYNQKIYGFPFDVMQFNDNQELIATMANYVKEKGILNLNQEFFDSAVYISSSYFALKRINSMMITTTNAYDSAANYQLIEYLQYLIESFYKETNNFLIMDYNLIEKAISIIVHIENSLNLPKIFWLYYCNGHMMPTSNIKWIIKNVINKNFNNFLFSWSWKIRSLFIKLVLYTIFDRLKYVNGKYLNMDLLNKLIEKREIDIDSPYKEHGIKDFNAIYEEYIQWKSAKEKNEYADYPIIFLPLAKNDNID